MTVNELITELNKVEDKDMPVTVFTDLRYLPVIGIHKAYDSIELNLRHFGADYGDFL